MTSKTFHIPDIGCDGCVRAIRNELEEMAGVQVLAAEVQELTARDAEGNRRLGSARYRAGYRAGPECYRLRAGSCLSARFRRAGAGAADARNC